MKKRTANELISAMVESDLCYVLIVKGKTAEAVILCEDPKIDARDTICAAMFEAWKQECGSSESTLAPLSRFVRKIHADFDTDLTDKEFLNQEGKHITIK